MRVGLITDHFNPHGGGAERWTAQFAAHLAGVGHDVHIVTFRAEDAPVGATMHLVPDPRTLLARARAVEAAVRGLGPMVLHDGGSSWSGHVFHPHTGSQVLSVGQELMSHVRWRRLRARVSPRSNWRRFALSRIEHRAAAQALRVVAVSRRIQAILAHRHGLEPRRLALVNNGVDATRFDAARLGQYRAAERARFQAGDSLLCLLVAHNLRLKGLDTALHALATLRAHGGDVRLLVAGGTPDRLWATLAERIGVADRVTFAGAVPDIERCYAAADVLVNPTRWDACSLATIEAMAAGLPVVTTAMNGAADLITDGVNGFVMADPNDHARLASCVAALRDPALRHRVGAAARAGAAAADIGANCRAVEAVLAEVARELQYSRP